MKDARFNVKHLNEHWMVVIPMNASARALIYENRHKPNPQLIPKWSRDFGPHNPEEEKREIIRKANALCRNSN